MKSRKSVPKTLKNLVWNVNNGKKNGEAPCYVCRKPIDSKNFEVGHIVPVKHGGKNVLTNLKPICSICNKSMGTQNLHRFKAIYFPEQDVWSRWSWLFLGC